MPACVEARIGVPVLTTEVDNTVSSPVPVNEAPVRKKHAWLPLLTVLFLISYGLMTMLIVEQGRTIESQRALIRELFRDSSELFAAKKAEPQKNPAAQRQGQTPKSQTPAVQAPETQAPETQAPETQAPETQAPAKQVPSTQAVPQGRAQNQSGKQRKFQMPSRPASDLSDDRRALITI